MANPLMLSPEFRRWIEQLLCCWSPASLTVTDLTVSDDLTVNGAVLRGAVAQPVIRSGTGTLAAGAATITGLTWITADTTIQLTYTGTVGASDAPLSRGAIVAGTSFAVTGTGTNTFSWTAFTPVAA